MTLIAEVLSWKRPELVFYLTDPDDFTTLVMLKGRKPTLVQYESWRKEYFRLQGRENILRQFGETTNALDALLQNDQAEIDRIKAKRAALVNDTKDP